METLNALQRQRLIDYKNKLIDEAKLAYNYASVEIEPIDVYGYLVESSIKERIAKDIENIIYTKTQWQC